jgi:hypothetical protein
MTVARSPYYGFSLILRLAALVLFILAIIVGFGWGLSHWEGLVATGLTAWVGSTLVP